MQNGLPALDDGRVLETANVIWCTGFQPGLDWIDLDIFADDGRRSIDVASCRPACSSSAFNSNTRRRQTCCPASDATPSTSPTKSQPAPCLRRAAHGGAERRITAASLPDTTRSPTNIHPEEHDDDAQDTPTDPTMGTHAEATKGIDRGGVEE